MALTAFAAAIACGSGSPSNPEAVSVEKAIRRMEKALSDSDVEALRNATTPEFYEAHLALAGPASITSPDTPELALGQRDVRAIQATRVDGDTATVDATINGKDALNVDAVIVKLVRRQGTWLVDYTGMRKLSNTGDGQVVEVTMSDFAFQPQAPPIQRNKRLVLRMRNSGAQPHMVGIWLVPEGSQLIKLIEATDVMPPGVQRIVNSQVFAAGDEGDIVVNDGLKPGRYMLTCFLSDITSPILTPHYDLGMLSEFEIK